MITLAFYHGTGGTWWQRWQDRAIRFRTGGPMSHVELIEGRAEYNAPALCLSASGRDGGVREKRVVLRKSRWTLVYLNRDPARLAGFIRQRIGARYDYIGIFFAQAIPLNVHREDMFFCSEIIAGALGLPDPHRMSPQSLFEFMVGGSNSTISQWRFVGSKTAAGRP